MVDKGCASDLEAGAEIAVGLLSLLRGFRCVMYLTRPSFNCVQVQIRSAIANYNTEQKALCLQSTSNSSYCATQLLTEVQTQSGTDLSLTNSESLMRVDGDGNCPAYPSASLSRRRAS